MNFTIQSLLDVSLVSGNISFGSMMPGSSNSTEDGDPLPFTIRNNGNVPVDVNITATDLWSIIPNPSSYFQYIIDEIEQDSWASALNTTWQDFNQTTYATAITQLNWTDSSDEAEIDIRITVPYGEPPGTKSAIVNITFY
jgi:hypothetical protein